MASLLMRGARLGVRLFTTPQGLAGVGTVGACAVASFQVEADSRDFFHHTFKTTKDPDAISDFYSTEDFLQILGIFPMAIHFVLAGVDWDTKRENTMDVWNCMQISFDITEKEETIDGETVVSFFNKRERFINYIPFTRILLWDQVQDYGYRRLKDGTTEVVHHGESFYGPWPIRLMVQLHAMYVIWATEKHINSELFGTEDLEAQEHQRSNIPLHAAKEWLATLQTQQQEAVKKAKLERRPTLRAEENLKALNRLQRMDTVIQVEHKFDGGLKVHVDDPAAKAAINAALRDIKKSQGSDAAAGALSSLLRNPAVLQKRNSMKG